MNIPIHPSSISCRRISSSGVMSPLGLTALISVISSHSVNKIKIISQLYNMFLSENVEYLKSLIKDTSYVQR